MLRAVLPGGPAQGMEAAGLTCARFINLARRGRKAHPFGSSTKLGLQENGRQRPRGTPLEFWP